MPTRERLTELVDRLPDGELAAAERYLEFLCADPVTRALAAAPEDDEPETEFERAAVQEARDSFANGESGASVASLRSDLGL